MQSGIYIALWDVLEELSFLKAQRKLFPVAIMWSVWVKCKLEWLIWVKENLKVVRVKLCVLSKTSLWCMTMSRISSMLVKYTAWAMIAQYVKWSVVKCLWVSETFSMWNVQYVMRVSVHESARPGKLCHTSAQLTASWLQSSLVFPSQS